MRPTDVAVAQRSRHPHPTVWLEVDYDGIQPPVALFADLEMIGWRPPAPASPPAEAIDWSTPDPVTGEDFTIGSWRVSGAVVRPPEGSGFRGHWTPGEAPAFLHALDGVLRRHGLLDDGAEPLGTGAARAAEAPPNPAPPPVPAPSPPTTPVPVGSSGEATGPRPARTTGQRGATTVVRAELLAGGPDEQAVAEALAPLGVTADVTSGHKVVTATYRGTTFERTVPVSRVELLVDDELAEVACAVLRDLRLEPELHRAPTTEPAALDLVPREPA